VSRMPTEKYDKDGTVNYECEECGRAYPSEQEALECEDSHEEEEHQH